jgi:hypothetical protein
MGRGRAQACTSRSDVDLPAQSRQVPARERVKAIIAGQEQSLAAHGSCEMPVWGPVFHDVEWDQDFGEVRLDNVTRFIESLQQK